MKPDDIPTQETVAFITSHSMPDANVLEIGCGDGAVASALMRRGYGVVGVDGSEEAVANARARGVAAVVLT